MTRKVYGQWDQPDLCWWGCTFVRRTGVFMDGHHVEERVVVIRLPVFGVVMMDYGRGSAWGQRTLIYQGQRGFHLGWHVKPDAERYPAEWPR